MFELEVGTVSLPADSLPASVLAAFSATRERIRAFSLTPWEEHCTECAMPACYATCDLYAARRDGKCRRFVHGIEILPLANHPQGYIAKIAFKRWGQLMAYANANVVALDTAVAIERRVRTVEHVASAVPGNFVSIAGRRGVPMRLARRWKQRLRSGSAAPAHRDVADTFMVEVFNPGQDVVRLTLSIGNPGRPPFQQLLELAPGYQRAEIALDAIRPLVELRDEMHVTLNPNILNADQEGLTLYFGLVGFVASVGQATPQPPVASSPSVKAIKVAVWDLDNTLWSGILIEDGPAKIVLREEAMTVVRELDRRGIVNSVLSKNHPDEALAALKAFGVSEYFVFPKIGWGEKGAYMKGLIRDFNVDANTFAFIDDQEFERAQVEATNPGVRTYDASAVSTLPGLPEFSPTQSAESASRRTFYRAEEHRVKDSEGFGGEYLTFLKTCGMRATISHPEIESFDRVQELVQRTNQLNYSGTHYSRAEISALLNDPANDAYTVACVDKYGEYGTVGFALIDRERMCLRDAMFSCRIQFKRVEHALLAFLLQRYRERGAEHFFARFRETKKNAAAAAVFRDLGFDEVARDGAERTYRFDLTQRIPDDGIVTVVYEARG